MASRHCCVAFENYDRFLRAFKQGKVTHLIVGEANEGKHVKVTLMANSMKERKFLPDNQPPDDPAKVAAIASAVRGRT